MSQNFDFAIVLDSQVREIVVLQTIKILQDNQIYCKQIKIDKDIIILIYFKDVDKILKTFEDLKFEKMKNSKIQKNSMVSQIDQSTIQKRQQKYKRFKEARIILSQEGRDMEMYSRFKLRKIQKFALNQFYTNEEVLEQIFTNAEREQAVYQILSGIKLEDTVKDLFGDKKQKTQFLLGFLKIQGVLKDLVPLRKSDHLSIYEIMKIFVAFLQDRCNVEGFLQGLVDATIRQFGDQCAMYFYFLMFMLKQMWFLVIFGLIVFILDSIYDEGVNTSPFESLYAAVTVLWGSVFVGKWCKRQNELKVLLRSQGSNFDHYEKNFNLTLIKCFQHSDQMLFEKVLEKRFQNQQKKEQTPLNPEQIDPVTGLSIDPDQTFQQWKLYLISAFKTLPYLILLIIVLLVSLNIRGYIPYNSIIYNDFLGSLSKPGGIFDKETNWFTLTTVLHVFAIFIINTNYRQVSAATSLMEQHQSFHGYEASVIIKRSAFEMFSGFTDFFYIGFVRMDIIALRTSLLSMFMVDELRRLVTESFIPLISKWKLEKYISTKLSSEDQNLKNKVIQVYLPKYVAFDDYLEIILNFGYILFFISAYPLAACVVQLFLLIEFISDYYKVNNFYQKPLSMKTKGIGPWVGAMQMICIVSVFTNLILFAFASDKIVEFFPELFVETAIHKPIHNHTMMLMATPLPGKGKYMITIVIVFEHLLFLLMWVIRTYISSRKDWVDIYNARKNYKKTIKRSFNTESFAVQI